MRSALLCSVATLSTICWPVAVASQAVAGPTVAATGTTSPTSEPATDTAASVGVQPTPDNQLGDIIVTAQRRSENLQRAAVPVDVVSAAAVLKAGITEPTALGTLVPALVAAPNGGGTVSYFVRGVGNFASNPLFDSAVAFNYDGVYIGRETATSGLFYDLERIEVLKGPQGTLYGRNATGGAINVNPVHPKVGTLSGYATASYGDYNAFTAEGALNLPLGPLGALRISGDYARHDGHLSDGTSDEKLGGVRAQMLGELTPSLTVRVSGDYEHIGGRGVGSSYANGLQFNPAAGGFVVVDSGLGHSVGLYDPAAQAYRTTLAAGPAGRKLAPLDAQPYVDNNIYGANAEIAYDTGFGKLTVIPAWRYSTVNTITAVPGFMAGLQTKDEQYSVEARFAGDRIGPFDYTLGGLYYNETNRDHFAVDQQALATFQDFVNKTDSYAVFARATAHLSDALRLVGGVRYTKDDKRFDGASVGLTVVCVVRVAGVPTCPNAPLLPFTWTPAQLTLPVPPVAGAAAPVPGTGTIIARNGNVVDASLNKGRVTYRGAVEYDVGPRSLAYASVETGFRAGGFSLAQGYETYQPETITAYTVGSKNRFLDNRLQLNVEGFLWKYRNQQLAHIGVDLAGQNGNFTQNIGRTTMYGVDAESRLLVTPTTALNAQVQYLHTRYDSFAYQFPNTATPPLTGCLVTPVAGNATVLTVDCSGKPAFNSPTWTVNLGADQTIRLGRYKVVGSIDSQYRSGRFVGFEFQAAERQGPTWQTSIQVSFGPDDDRWSIEGFVRNIENDRYITNAQYFLIGNGLSIVTAPPRTYGVRGAVRF